MKNWNRLSRDTAETSTLEIFKKRWETTTWGRTQVPLILPTGTGTEHRWQFRKVAPSPPPWPAVLKTRRNHQAHTCQLWQEHNNVSVSNKTSLFLQQFYISDSKFNIQSSRNHASSLQSLNSSSQVFHSCIPHLALLNISLCTLLKMPSCWFQTLELKIFLNSDSGHRGQFPNLYM